MIKKKACNKVFQIVTICMLILFYLISAFESVKVDAAVYEGQEISYLLINTAIGRYKLNYTGNSNHYAYWNNMTGQPIINNVYTDLSGWGNSSAATLTQTPGATGIKYAFLVWETRAPEGATLPIVLKTPNGRYYSISPTYAVNDWRAATDGTWANSTMYCMAADVTGYVKAGGGYGNYSVCNIPRWSWGANGDHSGGESPGSWQLIVVEEGKDFPVRAVSLKMGAEFKLETNYASELIFSNGITTKSSGNATGQIFFGASNESGVSGLVAMTENISSYDSNGGLITNAVSNTTTRAGLYRNGNLVNDRDYEYGCIRMDLSDINTNIGNSAKVLKSYIENTGWTTFFLFGTAVDIAFPDFATSQTTTVNSSTSVTVSGSIQNVSASQNTGIYDGKLVVNLDSALTPQRATATVNGATVNGTITGNAVIFDVSSMMREESIRYSVECSTNNSGKTRFDNSDNFSGYLRADGVNTGYSIDNVSASSSYGIPKYAITLNKGTGIETVTGAGEYIYGSNVSIGAELTPGYHWKGWTGSYTTAQERYSFPMPAGNLTMTAEGEANRYTIVFHPNDGGEVVHMDDIVTTYDAEITLPDILLPDGTGAYQKYTQDGVNVTGDVLSGAIVISEPDAQSEDDGEDAEVTGESEEVQEEMEEETGEPEEELTVQSEEELAAQSEPQAKVYPSIFMGWSLEDRRMSFIPQWTAGESLETSALAAAANVIEQDGATITLYAVWDDCPWIQAVDLYYTLEQAQSGFITENEILSHASASDREDGSPIAPGVHDDGTAFTIPDYSPTDFTQFKGEGSCTENLTVVDSVGNVYVKQITVYIVDTTAVAVKPEGTTRFIDEKYYNASYENGGLEENSLWKNNPEYVTVIEQAFSNLRNDTPQESYQFTHETILEMKEYIKEHGFSNSKEKDALWGFYEQLLIPNKVN